MKKTASDILEKYRGEIYRDKEKAMKDALHDLSELVMGEKKPDSDGYVDGYEMGWEYGFNSACDHISKLFATDKEEPNA